jgi:hypothetical protein
MWYKVLLIVAVNLIVFWRSLKCGYIIDDEAIATDSVRKVCNNGQAVKIDVSQIPEEEQKVVLPMLNQILQKFTLHPNETLINRSFWNDLKEHVFGTLYTYPGVAHFANIFFHTLNCVLIYLVFGRSDISLLAAVLFAVHPVNNQVSVWLSGRTYSIAASLLLLGMLFERFIPVGYAVALYNCIAILPLPLLYLFYKPLYLLFLLPPIAYLVRKKYTNTISLRWNTVPQEMKQIKWQKIIIGFKTLGYYACHSILPIKVGMCHDYLHNMGFSDKDSQKCYKIDRYFFIGILFFVGTFTAYGMGYRKEVFGLIWYIVFMAQWLNVILITHPISESIWLISGLWCF